MPKAVVTTKGGATITIEGTQGEVAEVLRLFEVGSQTRRGEARPPQGPRSRPTPSGLITELIVEGYFKEPRELGAVKLMLEEKGHFYPVTTLSPLMLRFVRKRELRRIKEKKRWLYVGW